MKPISSNPVCLIENQCMGLIKLEVPLSHQIEQTSRGCHQDIQAA